MKSYNTDPEQYLHFIWLSNEDEPLDSKGDALYQ